MSLRTILSLIGTGGIDTTYLADDAVTADKVADGAIDDSAKIGAGVVDASDLSTAALQADLYYAVVDAVTIGNIADLGAGAPNSVDGYTPSANDDILVGQQTDASENGIYNVDTVGTGSDGAWTRETSRDTAAEYPVGMLVYDKNTQKMLRLVSFDGTLDTDDMTFEIVEEGISPTNGGEPESFSGDGSTLNFDLSSANVVAVTVFVDGLAQDPSLWSVSAGAGAGGVDQLQFSSGNAPGSGAAVEVVVLTRS